MGKNRIKNMKQKLDLKDDFEHKKTLNVMIKAIWVAPIHQEVKMIMTYRLNGSSPKFWNPMTIVQTAEKLLGHYPKTEELAGFIALEKFGKQQVELFMKQYSNQEIIHMFNEEYKKNMGHMFAENTFDRKNFKV